MKLQPSAIKIIIGEVFDKFISRFDITEQVYDIDCIRVPLVDDLNFSIDAHIYCDGSCIIADFGSLQINKGDSETDLIALLCDYDEQMEIYDKINRGLKFYISQFYNDL